MSDSENTPSNTSVRAAPDAAASAEARRFRPRTAMVRGGLHRSTFGETSEAIFLTSGFRYDQAETAEARFKGDEVGFTYSRLANPTVATFEQRLAQIEGAEACRATASGMAAIYASIVPLLQTGDHVVAARAMFGSVRYILNEILPRFGVTSTLVDGCDLDQWRAAMRPGSTKVVFLETPANPTLEIVDLAAVAEIAHACGAKLIVDNVFATPVLQRPLEFGADVVVYSATKHIDGQGRCLGGAILASQRIIDECYQGFLRHTGPALSAFNAWVMLKGLETLDLRVREASRSAERIADFLAAHSRVANVRYPTRGDGPQAALARAQMDAGGSIVTFEVADGKAGAFRFMNRLRLIDISNNLGDAKSLIAHPATTTHQGLPAPVKAELGITEALVRLSVGLEDPADLESDLGEALAA
jgi:O-succinylhomoserine sulfhydrylase